MIVSIFPFKKYKSRISEILFNEAIKIKLKKTINWDAVDKKFYQKKYQENFLQFPVFTEEKSDEIIVNSITISNYLHYYDLENSYLEKSSLDVLDESTIEVLRFDIENVIDDKLNNLIYKFNELIEAAKSSTWFACITDTTLIIKNLLNYYINIVTDDTIQLNFINGIQFTKEISDILTNIYIELLKDKLEMLEIKDIKQPQKILPNIGFDYKFEWKGKQQDLLELFVELERKNWIEPLGKVSLHKSAKLLSDTFNLNDVKAEKQMNKDSLYTILKGEYDEKNIRKYIFDKPKYKRRFGNLTLNTKPN